MPYRFSTAVKVSVKILQTILIVGIISLFAQPAQAGFKMVGFQYVAPQAAPAPMPAPETASTPAPVILQAPTSQEQMAPAPSMLPSAPGPAVISPIVIEGKAQEPAPQLQPTPAEMPIQTMQQDQMPSLPRAAVDSTLVTSNPTPIPMAQPPAPGAPSAQMMQNDYAPAADNGMPSVLSASEAPPPLMPENASTMSDQQETAMPNYPAPMPAAPLMAMPENTQAMPGNASMGSDEIVQGFANSVPLAVALQQVLPKGYGFSIDQDVDLGTLVSFQGGKPWRDTLMAMLVPAGLTMREQGPMVSISHAQQANNMMPLPPPAGMAVATNTPPQLPPSPPVAQPAPQAKWPGTKINGPKPHIMQPAVADLPPKAPSPLATTLRVTPSPIVDTWIGDRGQTLHKVLEVWSRRAGVEFHWSAEYDYPLQASMTYTGTFEEAVRSLLSGFEEAHPQPVAELHTNTGAGQMVLVIQTRGNSYTN